MCRWKATQRQSEWTQLYIRVHQWTTKQSTAETENTTSEHVQQTRWSVIDSSARSSLVQHNVTFSTDTGFISLGQNFAKTFQKPKQYSFYGSQNSATCIICPVSFNHRPSQRIKYHDRAIHWSSKTFRVKNTDTFSSNAVQHHKCLRCLSVSHC